MDFMLLIRFVDPKSIMMPTEPQVYKILKYKIAPVRSKCCYLKMSPSALMKVYIHFYTAYFHSSFCCQHHLSCSFTHESRNFLMPVCQCYFRQLRASFEVPFNS